MIISIKTQHDMYDYILSLDKIGIEKRPCDLPNDILKRKIKKIATKLDRQNKLFIKKAQVSKEIIEDKATHIKKQVLKMDKVYRYKSNYLIYDTLQDTGVCNALVVKHKSKIQNHEPIKYIEDIKESGSELRKTLIDLCIDYYNSIEYDIQSKSKSTEEYELKKACDLAEEAIAKYIKTEYFNNRIDIVVKHQKKFYSIYSHDGRLIPDIFIIDKINKLILVIDVKVYSVIGSKKGCRLIYDKNDNRFQINSYMGKIKQELEYNNNFVKECNIKDKNGYNIKGILLHVVNKSLWEENKGMQGTELTIEYDRPIKLYMVKDTENNGFANIKSEIKDILDKELY